MVISEKLYRRELQPFPHPELKKLVKLDEPVKKKQLRRSRMLSPLTHLYEKQRSHLLFLTFPLFSLRLHRLTYPQFRLYNDGFVVLFRHQHAGGKR